MQVKDLIEKLQQIDPHFKVTVENEIPAKISCPECAHYFKTVGFTGEVDGVKVAGARCEAVIQFV